MLETTAKKSRQKVDFVRLMQVMQMDNAMLLLGKALIRETGVVAHV
jgi:hypothetical protein